MAILFAYYDWLDELPWPEAHHLNSGVLATLQCPAEYFVIDRPGRKTRCVPLARFSRETFKDCILLGLFSFEGNDVDLHHPRACSVFMTDAPGRAMYIYDMRGSMREADAWLSVAQPILERSPGGVGFAVELPSTDSPEAFAFGLDLRSRTESEYQSNENWQIWRRDNVGVAPSKLRDVYGINVLPRRILDSEFAGCSLAWWIDQDPRRGDLRPFGDGTFLWTIDIADLPVVRDELRLGGKLF